MASAYMWLVFSRPLFVRFVCVILSLCSFNCKFVFASDFKFVFVSDFKFLFV